MRGFTDDENDYDEVINCESVLPTRKFPATGPVLKKGRVDRRKKESNMMFEQMLTERDKRVNAKLMQRKQVVRGDLTTRGGQPKLKQVVKDVIVTEDAPINIPKMHIATIFFQQSDEEVDGKGEKLQSVVEDKPKQEIKRENNVKIKQ